MATLGDAGSPELGRWQAELESARAVFRITYADNSLAQRCADILDMIVPSNPTGPPAWDNVQFDSSLIDFSTWPSDGGEFLGMFGWPTPGRGI